MTIEFGQRALLYTYREAVSYQQNREKILQLAAAEIERDPPQGLFNALDAVRAERVSDRGSRRYFLLF